MKRIPERSRSPYLPRRPCFGFFLQGAVKSLAITDVGVQIGMLLCTTTGILSAWNTWHDFDSESAKNMFRKFSWTFSYVYHIGNILFTKYLYLAADNRDRTRLLWWFIFSATFFIANIADFFIYTFWMGWSHFYGIGVFATFVIYKLYAFWVLLCYIMEINYYGGFNSALRELSDEEIQSFLPHPEVHTQEYTNSRHRPYESDMEIPFNCIMMDERSPLGCGTFGTVLKAKLLAENDGPLAELRAITVAVKTLSPNADICYFKSLLLELKILSYVGRHENVVNLVGACTSMLKERKIYIVVEFCKLGCITNYLRANRGTFIPSYNVHSTPGSGLSSECDPPSLLDLVKWSLQTASGMKYITSKKIIHGDLAGRNVLLTGDKVAKIADFGLSRQLYHYSTYIKKNDEPLPWRWLSPESLGDLHFSTASDVWSFGITMWEYFTLGETPYPFYGYTTEFIKQLRSGHLRPNRPPYAADEIFAVMQSCWNSDPQSRPSFKEIKTRLEQILLGLSQPPRTSGLSEYICV